MHERSAALAISPPSASSSRTRCPFPVPPIAGLQGMLPTASRLIVKTTVRSPILAQECIEDYLTFDAGHPGDVHFALRVRGESMLNAGILPGDLVVVRQQQTCNPGEIVVAMIDDEATVKRFSRKNGHVWLMPENDAYTPIDGTYAQILGKVVAVVRQY